MCGYIASQQRSTMLNKTGAVMEETLSCEIFATQMKSHEMMSWWILIAMISSFMVEPFGTGALSFFIWIFSDHGSGVPERHLPSGPDPRSISGTWEVVPNWWSEMYHKGIVRYGGGYWRRTSNMERVMNLSSNIATVDTNYKYYNLIKVVCMRDIRRRQSRVGFASVVFFSCVTQTQVA